MAVFYLPSICGPLLIKDIKAHCLSSYPAICLLKLISEQKTEAIYLASPYCQCNVGCSSFILDQAYVQKFGQKTDELRHLV